MPRAERRLYDNFDDVGNLGDNRSGRRRGGNAEMKSNGDKRVPRIRSNKISEVDDILTVFVSSDYKNFRVLTKLDKQDPRTVFAAKSLKLVKYPHVFIDVSDLGTMGLVLASLFPQVSFTYLIDNPEHARLLKRNIQVNAERVYNLEVVARASLEEPLSGLVVFAPESHIGLEAIGVQIQKLYDVLSENADFILLTHRKFGGPRHAELLKQVFGDPQVISEKTGMGGHMLVQARKKAGVGQKYVKEARLVTISILGQIFQAVTLPGLFSKEGLDSGTRLLLENTESEIKNAQRVLDVGCGWGAIGLTCLSVNPQIRAVMVDVDPRAIEVTQRNVQRAGVGDRAEVVLSADPSQAAEEFDLVLSNPPFHEKEGVLVELFQNTKSTMTKGGQVFIVVEDTHRGKFENIMQRVFGGYSEVARRGNYTILKARK